MDPLHICVGDRIIAHKPKLNGELDAYEVEEVEAFLCRRTVRICQVRVQCVMHAGSSKKGSWDGTEWTRRGAATVPSQTDCVPALPALSCPARPSTLCPALPCHAH